WSSDVCSSDLGAPAAAPGARGTAGNPPADPGSCQRRRSLRAAERRTSDQSRPIALPAASSPALGPLLGVVIGLDEVLERGQGLFGSVAFGAQYDGVTVFRAEPHEGQHARTLAARL